MWILVTGFNSDGNVEYQVSDGVMGERTISYDFDNLPDAIKCLNELKRKEYNGKVLSQ